MRNLLLLAVMAFITPGLIACGGKDKRSSVRVSDRGKRDGGDSTGTNRTLNEILTNASKKGEIITDQVHLDAFVSAQGKPDEVVGLIGGSGTGVFFAAKARVSGEKITGAELALEIRDSWYVDDKKDPLRINTLTYVSGSGTIKGSNCTSCVQDVYMEFTDSYQTVAFNGKVEGQTFKGDFEFKNKKDYQDKSPWEGVLGEFSIPTCSVFDCN